MISKLKFRFKIIFALIFLLFALLNCENLPSVANASINGGRFEIKLGGLFSIFERGTLEACDLNTYDYSSIQHAEMALFAIDQINKDPKLLPGIKLSLSLLADCQVDTKALHEILKLISMCKADDRYQIGEVDPDHYWGIIGPGTSLVAVPIAKLLGLFDFPQISCQATSSVLSDKQSFPSFFRTVPSDVYQVTAIIELLKQNNWRYVLFIHQDDDYGNAALDAFKLQIRNTSICLAEAHKLRQTGDNTGIKDIAESLEAEPSAKVVVAFLFGKRVVELLTEVHRKNMTRKFQWIGSDGWGDLVPTTCSPKSTGPAEEYQAVMDRSIIFQLHVSAKDKFEDYLRRRTIADALSTNYYLASYIALHNNCSLMPNTSNTCDYSLTLPHHDTAESILEIQHSLACSNMVYAFAHALDDAREDLCGDALICDEFKQMNKSLTVDYLKRVNFTDIQNSSFTFDPSHDGPSWYDILRFDSTSGCWLKIGEFKTRIDFAAGMRFDSSEEVTSTCSDECEVNEYRVIYKEKPCCWHCERCDKNSILNTSYVESAGANSSQACIACDSHSQPNGNICVTLVDRFLSFDHALSWPVAILASIGLLLALIVAFVYALNWNTPLIRASGRELSSLILIGICSIFSVPFLFCVRPTYEICAARRFGICICFSIVFAGLLVKTIRISFVFNNLGKKLDRDFKFFLRPTPQVLIALMLILVETFILIVWHFIENPMVIVKPFLHNTEPEKNYKNVDCSGLDSVTLLVGLSFPILLILVCTYFAVRIRKVPAGFNEAKYIGFAVYSTLVIWMAQLSTYFVQITSEIELRDAICCLLLSLNALIILFALFGPKVYIAVLRPEKNNQNVVMSRQRHASQASAVFSISTMQNDDKHERKREKRISSSALRDKFAWRPFRGTKKSQQSIARQRSLPEYETENRQLARDDKFRSSRLRSSEAKKNGHVTIDKDNNDDDVISNGVTDIDSPVKAELENNNENMATYSIKRTQSVGVRFRNPGTDNQAFNDLS